MTLDRKNEIFDQMLYWINEHIQDDRERYSVLHATIGMSHEELHDCCIDSLDEFFEEDSAISHLKEKVDRCYAEYRETWLQMTPEQLLARCEEIEAVTRLATDLPRSISEEDAAYLLRFVNPLEVVSDSWVDRNGVDSLIANDEIRDIVWNLSDRGDAELSYPVEPVKEQVSGVKNRPCSSQER